MTNKNKVGYCSPPKKNQWKQGQSGNPKGRPKGAKNLETVVVQEALAVIAIKEGNKILKITKVEALMKRMIAKGIQGDNKAAKIALDLIGQHLPQIDQEAANSAPLTDKELTILSNHADFLDFVEGETDE